MAARVVGVGVLEPGAGRDVVAGGRRHLTINQVNPEVGCRSRPAGGRRGQPHDRGHDDYLDQHREQALP